MAPKGTTMVTRTIAIRCIITTVYSRTSGVRMTEIKEAIKLMLTFSSVHLNLMSIYVLCTRNNFRYSGSGRSTLRTLIHYWKSHIPPRCSRGSSMLLAIWKASIQHWKRFCLPFIAYLLWASRMINVIVYSDRLRKTLWHVINSPVVKLCCPARSGGPLIFTA